MRSMTTAAWCVVLATALPLFAQNKDDGRTIGHWGDHLGPQAPDRPAIGLDWEAQRSIAANHARWTEWAANNPGWVMLFDPRTRMPWRGYGPGIQVTASNPSHADVVAAALQLRETLSPVIGVEASDQLFVTAQRAGHVWYVDFNQTITGHRVVDAGLTLRIDESGKLMMWGGRFVPTASVALRETFTRDEARAKTLTFLWGQGYATSSTQLREQRTELVVHVSETTADVTPRLAWFMQFSSDAPAAAWNVFIDATTGEVITHWNDVREFGHDGPAGPATPFEALFALATLNGVSNGTVHDGVLPDQAPVLRNLPNMYININGTNVPTDAAGAYTFNGGGATVPVTSGLDGQYITTVNTGTQAAFNGNAASGTFDVVWTDTNSNVAERDGFFFGTRARNVLKLRNPAETLFNNAIVCNVNLNQTCNAFYQPSNQTINFFLAGGGCINTAYSGSVVYHEYGHHVTTIVYGSHSRSIPGYMGEGLSDCQAAAVEDTNIIGAGFQGPGTMVRNLNNTCQYPTSCGTEVHARGQLIGACFWHTRVQFANAFGAAGKVQIDEYLYRHFHGSPQDEVESCLDLLVQDDNDANLVNGTPNVLKFYQGFTVQHGVPFPIALVAITHDPLNDTLDQLQNYQVHATAASLVGSSVTSVQLFYSVNNAAFVSVPMTFGGADYAGSIPVQAAASSIRYYIRVQDSGGLISFLPAGAPAAAYTFRNFRSATFFSDGFEVASGWTHALVLGQDDWQNQAPGSATHAYDPHTAFEGTKCWGNDLSAAGFNGNYANNVNNNLTSPAINCTGRVGVTLVYRRWLTVEDGLFDHARILVSNNGTTYTTVWENPATAAGNVNFLDTSWVLHSVPIGAIADNQANVRIRFELVTDAGLVFGGWNVDDLRLESSAGATGVPLTRLGGLTPGSSATVRTNGNPGEAIFLAADVATSGTFYPGVGTLSMNVASPTFLPIYLGGVTIGGGGFDDLTFTVPNASGITVFFQGVLFPPSAPTDPVITNVLLFPIQ